MLEETAGARARMSPAPGEGWQNRSVAAKLVIVAGDRFSAAVDGAACAEALAQGITATAPELDPRPLALGPPGPGGVALSAAPAAIRAVVVAAPDLGAPPDPSAPAFLLATAARQGGIPAYGVSALAQPQRFYARMLDLQVILHATDRPALVRAGRRLGRILIEQFR